jgi:hypothetical protein
MTKTMSRDMSNHAVARTRSTNAWVVVSNVPSGHTGPAVRCKDDGASAFHLGTTKLTAVVVRGNGTTIMWTKEIRPL